MPITVVTGVSKGIGRALADHLANEGHHVIGLSRTKPDAGFKGEFHAVDLSDLDATKKAMDAIATRHAIDHLVHNAGIIQIAQLEDMSIDQFDAMLTVNLRVGIVLAQAVIPAMKKKKRGRIVMIGSRAALGKVGRGGYSATKAALLGFVRTWAMELGPHGITVNCVAPGPTATEMFRAANPPDSPSTKAIIASIPMRRMGQPEEVAAACGYFLQDAAGFTTGQVLYVDGGITVGLSPI